jgi:hypothetical protein
MQFLEQTHRQVEGVVGCLVLDNAAVPVRHRKVGICYFKLIELVELVF